jgi:type I restriction enzyme S subunit
MSQLLPAAGGTIFPNVSQSQLRDFKLWWPPEIERKRISNILTSIEDVIQATERAVVEAKNLRSGLLSDLLSGEHEIPVSYDELLGAA